MKLVTSQECWLAFHLPSQMVACPLNSAVGVPGQGKGGDRTSSTWGWCYLPPPPPPRRGCWHGKSYATQEANWLWGKDVWSVFWPVSRNGCCSSNVRAGTRSVTPWWEQTDCSQGSWGMVIWTVPSGSYSSLLDCTILSFCLVIENVQAEPKLKKNKTKPNNKPFWTRIAFSLLSVFRNWFLHSSRRKQR